ncbi:ABC transporter ATP-binding protein [Williamsia sterculiae]|uniref:ATP-binding cassette, subfamily C n=1 Tax=Williamsia sterculiae TaxID=1344003 RepID=A0A1N7CF25_9NOCA|nr:ABC transporter ATP-binding protein [Williamsia sterculiae]SIR62251.1 ATP-binding cassette, subfamily C [Williamsia sterculiae]
MIPDVETTVARRLPVATSAESARWLRWHLRRHPWLITVSLCAGIAAAVAALVPVYAIGWLVDAAVTGRSARSIVPVAVVLAVAAAVTGLLTGAANYTISRLGETVAADLRESVVARTLRLPDHTVEEVGRGDVLSRVGDDVSQITRAAGEVIPTVLNAALLVVVSVISMFGLDYRLGLTGLAALPLYVLALRWYLPRSAPVFAAERAAMGDRSEALASSLQGIRTVRVYGLESQRLAMIDAESNRARALAVSVFRLFVRFVGRENRAEFVGLSLLLIVGFLLYRGDLVTIGAVTTAILLFHRLFNPLGAILFTFSEVQSAAAGLNRLVGIVDIPDDHRPVVATPTEFTLTLDGVGFGYTPGRPVLHDVSLTVAQGTRLAVVGASGAGKTTAALIAAGSLSADAGSVQIGGIPLSDIGTDELRTVVSILSQDVHVTTGSLIDDLRLADPRADADTIWRALDTVGAGAWVRHLPAGLDTPVGEHGHPLSAEQEQQLALVRLVLRDPPVAILDEATAEAGSSGAAELERAASAATRGRTTLVVAHRLTQAANADAVVVLDRGRVVETGTHDALIAGGGIYSRLWDAWRDDPALH